MQRINELIDRAFHLFARQNDTRRAGIIGIFFGLLLCVIVVMICIVLGFVAELGA